MSAGDAGVGNAPLGNEKPLPETVDQELLNVSKNADPMPGPEPQGKPKPQRPGMNRFTTSKENVLSTFFIGAIDQGTTSTRFIIFDGVGQPVASHQH